MRHAPPVLFIALPWAATTFAQDAGLDAGVIEDAAAIVDGGAPWPARCEGNTLIFCDALTGEERTLSCDELGATCGLLSDAWGFDCLLPEGAPCEPGYANGLSRCAGASSRTLCCVDGTCAEPPSGTERCHDLLPDPPPVPGPGGEPAPSGEDTPATSGCPVAGCTQAPASLAALLLGLALGRARRRRP